LDLNQLRQESRLLSPREVCAQIVALSVVEHSHTPSLRIDIELDRCGAAVSDTGRGMRLTPDRGDTLSHAERALTSLYPCLPLSPEVESILRELVWGERGSLGPALANFACPSLHFVSKRDGEVWSQSYRHGTPVGPPMMLGPTQTTGTTIKFETSGPIDHAMITALVDSLRFRIPGLVIAVQAAR